MPHTSYPILLGSGGWLLESVVVERVNPCIRPLHPVFLGGLRSPWLLSRESNPDHEGMNLICYLYTTQLYHRAHHFLYQFYVDWIIIRCSRSLNFLYILYHNFYRKSKFYCLHKKGKWKLCETGLPTLVENVGLEPLSSIPNAVCKPLHFILDWCIIKWFNQLITSFLRNTAANFHL